MALYLAPVVVKNSPIHWRGVFASVHIKAGELIEECHTIINKNLAGLVDYSFKVYEKPGFSAMPLGFGAIYNHSPVPNATYDLNSELFIMRFIATRDISPGEEIFVSYGQKWFDKRCAMPAQLSMSHRIKMTLIKMSMVYRFLFVSSLLFGLLFFVRG